MKRTAPPLLVASLLTLAAFSSRAAEARYEIDPQHTYPSFEADHMGMDHWRGKFNRSAGSIMLDKQAGTGSIDVTVDIDSIDFGLDALNKEALGAEMFDAAKFPTATYKGKLATFVDGKPTTVDGALTLHGVTRPLTLRITQFKCMPHPLNKKDWCGADAEATFDRSQFGIDAGKDWGFDMAVALKIQVEAIAEK